MKPIFLAVALSLLFVSCVSLNPEDRYPTNQPMLGKYYNKRVATDAEWALVRAEAQAAADRDGKEAAIDKFLEQAWDVLFSDPATAVQNMNRAYLLDESSPKVHWYFALWVATIGRGDPMDLFQKAIDLNAAQKQLSDPQLGNLYADIGIYYFKKGSTNLRQGRQQVVYLTDAGAQELSLTYFEKAVEIDPSNGATYVGWSQPLYMLGKFEEALFKLMKAKELGTRIDESYYAAIYAQYIRQKNGKS